MAATQSKMTVTQLTILTAVNMMGSGIILLPAKLAEVGTISIFSWIITAGGSLALAYAFARCGMLSRKPGGMGGYAEYAFGKAGNYMANYTYGLSLVIANVAIAITAVGYGDRFPVTLAGRLVGLFVMLTGVGIIAALASILASLLVPPPPPDDDAATPSATRSPEIDRLADEIAALRTEVAALRAEARAKVIADQPASERSA